MRWFTRNRVAALAALALAACDGPASPLPQASPPPAKPKPAPLVPWRLSNAAGAIEGRVTFAGTPPPLRPIVIEDKRVAALCPEGIPRETWVVGADGAVANCVVYVKRGFERFAFEAPSQRAFIRVEKFRITPHVQAVRVGQEVEATYGDEDTAHNLHAPDKMAREFLPHPTDRFVFDELKVSVFVKCDIHGWEGAYVAVLPHPFFAVTGVDGRFALPPINPGTYEIEVWHEKLGTLSRGGVVKGPGTERVDFEFKR